MENLLLSCITQELHDKKDHLVNKYKKFNNNKSNTANTANTANNDNNISHPKRNRNIPITTETKNRYFGNAAINEEELIQRLGQKWKINIVLIGAFTDVYQSVTSDKYYNPLPIATTSDRLLQLYKNPMNVSRVLRMCQKIGLLYCPDDWYSYTYGASRIFYYNKDIQTLIKKTIKKYNLVTFKRDTENVKHIKVTKNNSNSSDSSDSLAEPKEKEEREKTKLRNLAKVKFSSKLRIGGNLTEAEVLNALHTRYPQLEHYQELADRLNKKLPQELKIKFAPHITTSAKGYITKIGIRATNSIVSLKEHENEHKEYTGVWRKDFLKQYFGSNKYYEFDVKSSIYRIAYLLKTGKWLDNDIDVYELMNGQSFEDGEDRANYKQFAQRLYFDSPEKLFNNIKEAIPESILYFGESKVRESLRIAKRNMKGIIGESKDSEIFLHESCIYLDFYKYLIQKGLDVVQVYDGFYCMQDLTPYIGDLRRIAEEYYNKYIKNTNKVERNREYKEYKNIRKIIKDRNNIKEIKKAYKEYYISMVNTFKGEHKKNTENPYFFSSA